MESWIPGTNKFDILGLRHCSVLDKYQCPLNLWPCQRQTMRSPSGGVEGYGLLTTAAHTYSMRSWDQFCEICFSRRTPLKFKKKTFGPLGSLLWFMKLFKNLTCPFHFNLPQQSCRRLWMLNFCRFPWCGWVGVTRDCWDTFSSSCPDHEPTLSSCCWWTSLC